MWGAKDVSYQRHVIMGFAGVPNPRYNVDFDLLVAMLGHRVLAGTAGADLQFTVWMAECARKAK